MNTETHYKTDTLDLRLMDCMELMRETPDKFYDLAVVDPPYGIGFDGAKKTSGSHGGRKAHDFKGWDSKRPDEKYWRELFRVSKNQIVWGANYFTQFLPPSMGWIIWRKDRGEFSSSDAELAYTSFDRALREWTKNPLILVREGGTIHPTQKPVALYRWIFANYAKPGMRILDTHLGSMSIAIAAHYGGVHLTGCELDPDYFAAGIARVKKETAQLTLF